MRILALHGPNLNLLGQREVALYGTASLPEIDEALRRRARELDVALDILQSNHEGVLLDALHAARPLGDAPADGVLLNAGAFSHTSLALADAVRGIAPLPVVEVHLTNTASRDAPRRRSLLGAACWARVEGFGAGSYLLALEGLVAHLRAADTGPERVARA